MQSPLNSVTPKRPADSATEMVQVVLPNDANPLGYVLGGEGGFLSRQSPQPNFTSLEIDGHAIGTEKLVADDAAELEAQQHAWGA